MHNYLELQLISSQIGFKYTCVIKWVLKIMFKYNMVLIVFVEKIMGDVIHV